MLLDKPGNGPVLAYCWRMQTVRLRHGAVNRILGAGAVPASCCLPPSCCRGFTLLEVLAALAIFALASSVLLVTDGSVLKQVSRAQAKLQAAWVADSTLNTYYTSANLPAAGTYARQVTQGNASWFVRSKIAPTSQSRLNRVEVLVFSGTERPAAEDVPAFRLTAFIRRPGS